jgi:hypothetical protein
MSKQSERIKQVLQNKNDLRKFVTELANAYVGLLETMSAEKTVPTVDIKAGIELLNEVCPVVSRSGKFFGEPIFYQVFGSTPTVGDKVSVSDVAKRLGFSKDLTYMKVKIKGWLDKGQANIAIEYGSGFDDTFYVIKSLGRS